MKNKKEEKKDFIREFFKRFPRFYYFIVKFFGPILFVNLSPEKFLQKYHKEGRVLNIGSGPRKIRSSFEVVNMDIKKYENVDVVGNITSIPLESESFISVICDNVLEHVDNTERAIGELERVTSSGGTLYVSTPFIYPFHSSPSDFYRWTKEGLVQRFSNFEIIEIGVRAGPFSSLNTLLCYLFSMVFSFGNQHLYTLLINLSIFIFFPIKFLDVVFNLWPNSIDMAASLYLVAQKK